MQCSHCFVEAADQDVVCYGCGRSIDPRAASSWGPVVSKAIPWVFGALGAIIPPLLMNVDAETVRHGIDFGHALRSGGVAVLGATIGFAIGSGLVRKKA